MRKHLIILIFLCTFLTKGVTQNIVKNDIKNAKKSLAKYLLDPKSNSDLYDAKSYVEEAFKQPIEDSYGDAWLTRGQIYVQIVEKEVSKKNLNPSFTLSNLELSNSAFESFKKSFSENKKESLNGFIQLIPLLSATGLELFYMKDYCKSYRDFQDIILIHDILVKNKRKSPLDDLSDLNNQFYISALAALNCGKEKEAADLFQKAYDGGFKTVEIYDGLARSYSKINPGLSQKYLEEGRFVFPSDNNLLFSKINEKLNKNEFDDQLLSLLNEGLIMEPQNVSLINTLANVYDKLTQISIRENDLTKGDAYFDMAIQNYKKSLLINKDNSFALYSIGTIYYNKASSYVHQMQLIASDFSPEGYKKYDLLEKSMKEMFILALPFFIKNSIIDSKDTNTLVALKEIFARLNIKSKEIEFQNKLDKLK